MRILIAVVALLALTISRAGAQKLEYYQDEKGSAQYRVQFKLTPKAIDENRVIVPLVWDFYERNSGNAAHSYNRAMVAYNRICSSRANGDYRGLLAEIWDKTDNNQTADRAFLIEKTIGPTVSLLAHWGRHPIPEDELTPEDLAAQQRDAFLNGISQKTWEHSYVLPLEKPEQIHATRDFIQQCDEVGVYRFIEEGSRCDHCDFGIPFHETDNLLGIRLEEIQDMRALGRLVQLRIMLELHEGRYGDALKSIRIGMTLARHTGKQPTLVSGLVGVALCGIMQEQLVDMINRPDSPNVYWEVSSLPYPLLSLGDAMEVEKGFVPQTFPLLKKAFQDVESLDDNEWRMLLDQMTTMLQQFYENESHKPFSISWPVKPTIAASYPSSRRWMLEQGKTVGEIDAMIPEKVVGLYAVHELQLHWNNYFRYSRFPLWEKDHAEENMQKLHQELQNATFRGNIFARRIICLLAPANSAARRAYQRIQSSNDMLRIAEAIRDYAAKSGGTVPATLNEITAVSVPMIDPFTGVPYDYKVVDGVGQIELSNMFPKCTVYFEIVK